MVHAQQIEESKSWEIRQEGKSHRSEESSQHKLKNRFYHQESSIGMKDRVSIKNSQVGGHNFERPRCATCGKQHLGMCIACIDGCYACASKNNKMRFYLTSRHKGIGQ